MGNVSLYYMINYLLNWLHFELDVTIFVTAKKGCSKTFDQYTVGVIITPKIGFMTKLIESKLSVIKFNFSSPRTIS